MSEANSAYDASSEGGTSAGGGAPSSGVASFHGHLINISSVPSSSSSEGVAANHPHPTASRSTGPLPPPPPPPTRARTVKKYLYLPFTAPESQALLPPIPQLVPGTRAASPQYPPRLGLLAAHNEVWSTVFARMLWAPQDWVYITHPSALWPHHPAVLADVLRSLDLVETLVVDAAAVAETAHAVQLRRVLDRNEQIKKIVVVDMSPGDDAEPVQKDALYFPRAKRIADLAPVAHETQSKVVFSLRDPDTNMHAVAWGSSCRTAVPDLRLRDINPLVPIANLTLDEDDIGRVKVWEFSTFLKRNAMAGTQGREWPQHVSIVVMDAVVEVAQPLEDSPRAGDDDPSSLPESDSNYWYEETTNSRNISSLDLGTPTRGELPRTPSMESECSWTARLGPDYAWLADVAEFPNVSGWVSEEDFRFNAGVGENSGSSGFGSGRRSEAGGEFNAGVGEDSSSHGQSQREASGAH